MLPLRSRPAAPRFRQRDWRSRHTKGLAPGPAGDPCVSGRTGPFATLLRVQGRPAGTANGLAQGFCGTGVAAPGPGTGPRGPVFRAWPPRGSPWGLEQAPHGFGASGPSPATWARSRRALRLRGSGMGGAEAAPAEALTRASQQAPGKAGEGLSVQRSGDRGACLRGLWLHRFCAASRPVGGRPGRWRRCAQAGNVPDPAGLQGPLEVESPSRPRKPLRRCGA